MVFIFCRLALEMGTLPLFSWCLVTRQKPSLLPLSCLPTRLQPTTRLPASQAARLPVQPASPAQCKAGVQSAVYAAGNLYMFDTFSNTNTHIHMHIIFTKARSFMKADLLFIACNAMLLCTYIYRINCSKKYSRLRCPL